MQTNLLVLSAALLGAALSAPVKDNTLSGRVTDWPTGKAGELRLMDFGTGTVYATGKVDEQGKFTLTLPDLKDKTDKLLANSGLFTQKSNYGAGCVGEGKANPSSGFFQEFQLIVNVDGQDSGDLTLDSSAAQFPKKGDAWSSLMFFTEPVALTGKLNCPAPSFNADFQGVYPAGWSLVRLDVAQDPKTTQIHASYDASKPLTGLAWRWFKEYGGIGMNLKLGTLIVDFLRADGAAERAGIKAGDELVSVNGQKVTAMEEALKAIRGDANTKVVLVVKRDGQERTFEITRSLVRAP